MGKLENILNTFFTPGALPNNKKIKKIKMKTTVTKMKNVGRLISALSQNVLSFNPLSVNSAK